jgi:ankyrin repeat protein
VEFDYRLDITMFLLSRGAKVNSRDENGVCPLHWAAVNGHLNCCRILLSHNADVNAMVDDTDV